MTGKPTLTARQFKAWRKSVGLSLPRAAEAIGVKKRQIGRYEAGETPVSYTVALACAAAAAGLGPWREK